jgi:3-mercaptopyruvate sulfurtransferase SseA
MFTRFCFAFGLLVSLFAFAGFSSGCNGSQSDKFLKPITVVDAQQLVQDRKKLLGLGGTDTGAWVDCRPDAAYIAGHIPGAINLPYERVSIEHKTLEKYDVIIVYGADYNDSSANGMSKRLMELGHGDVRTLIGGMRAWKSDGNPVEPPESK